jgi:hypothetical protein
VASPRPTRCHRQEPQLTSADSTTPTQGMHGLGPRNINQPYHEVIAVALFRTAISRNGMTARAGSWLARLRRTASSGSGFPGGDLADEHVTSSKPSRRSSARPRDPRRPSGAAMGEVLRRKRTDGGGRCPARTGDLLLVRREQMLRSTAVCHSMRSSSDFRHMAAALCCGLPLPQRFHMTASAFTRKRQWADGVGRHADTRRPALRRSPPFTPAFRQETLGG